MDETCVFCSIVSGDLKSEIIDSSVTCLAINDISPVANTHILVIPREHVLYLGDMDPEDLSVVQDMYILALKIVRSCDLEQKGYRLVINQKDDGGQQVPHLHMHLIGGESLGQMG